VFYWRKEASLVNPFSRFGSSTHLPLLIAVLLAGIVAATPASGAPSQGGAARGNGVRVYDVRITGSGTWGYDPAVNPNEERRTWTASFERLRLLFRPSGLADGFFPAKHRRSRGSETVSVVYGIKDGPPCWTGTYTRPADFLFDGGPFPYMKPNRFLLAFGSQLLGAPLFPPDPSLCNGYASPSHAARLEGARVGRRGVVTDGGIRMENFWIYVRLPRQRPGRFNFPLDRVKAHKAFALTVGGKFRDETSYAEAKIRISFVPSR
jgi:hypothetical protein